MPTNALGTPAPLAVARPAFDLPLAAIYGPFAVDLGTSAAGLDTPAITGMRIFATALSLSAGAPRLGPAPFSRRIALASANNLATGAAGLDQAPYARNAGVRFKGEKWAQRYAADYTIGYNGLLPTGPAWPRDPAEPLQLMVAGLAQVWGDVVDAQAALLLVTESDPRYTNMLLPDWERNWDLPDDCLPFPPTTIAARETALVQKMTLQGGQSKAFFTSQAAILGQNPVYEEYAPYMCGVSRVGDTRYALPHYSDDPTNFRWMCGPREIRFYFKVTITNVLSGVECVINRYRPTQTDAVFVYTSVLDRSSGVYPFLGF